MVQRVPKIVRETPMIMITPVTPPQHIKHRSELHTSEEQIFKNPQLTWEGD
jgi:hypothetical protein